MKYHVLVAESPETVPSISRGTGVRLSAFALCVSFTMLVACDPHRGRAPHGIDSHMLQPDSNHVHDTDGPLGEPEPEPLRDRVLVASKMAGPYRRIAECLAQLDVSSIALSMFSEGPRLIEFESQGGIRNLNLNTEPPAQARPIAVAFNQMESALQLAVHVPAGWFLSEPLCSVVNPGVMGVSEWFLVTSFEVHGSIVMLRVRKTFEEHGIPPTAIERRESDFLILASVGDSGVPAVTRAIEVRRVTRRERMDVLSHSAPAEDEFFDIDILEPYLRFDGRLELRAIGSSPTFDIGPGRYDLNFP